jgi:hypothetical protein
LAISTGSMRAVELLDLANPIPIWAVRVDRASAFILELDSPVHESPGE